MSLLALLLTPAVLASPPNRVAFRWELGTDVRDLALSQDGRWLGATESSGAALHVVDTWSWEETTVATCAGARGAAVADTADGARFYSGCSDGSVVVIEASEAGVTRRDDALALGDDPVLAVETDGATLWAVVDPASGNPKVVAWDLAGGAVSSLGAATLGASGVLDTAVAGSLLFVVHGGDNVSKVDTRTMSGLLPQENLGGRDFVDAWAYTSGTVFLADDNGSLCVYNAGGNDLAIQRDDLAAQVSAVFGDAAAGWMLVGTDVDARLFAFSGTPGEDLGTVEGAGLLRELVGAGDLAYGGTSVGELLVLSAAPWVEASSSLTTSVDTGATVPLTVRADLDSSYEVRLGGTLGTPGEVVASGTLNAGESLDVEVDVDAAFAEGANRLWVFATRGEDVGHALVPIVVDRAPPAPVLADDAVEPGDQRIRVHFDGLTAEDLVRYDIYLSDVAFTAADWPEGGPNPTVVEAAPGEEVDRWLEGLDNGTAYHVAVRAYDAGGRAGPMSEVRSVTPQETFAVSEVLGVGTRCGTSTPVGAVLVVMGMLLAAARRRGAPALAALLVAGLALPGQALALDTVVGLEARGGPVVFTEPLLQAAFGAERAGWSGGLGVVAGTRQVLLGAGVGLAPLSGRQVTAAGARSAEPDALQVAPVTVDLVLRLDVLARDRQPVVPFLRAGGDLWPWREAWTEDGEDLAAAGLATGWHAAAGAMLRLDALDPDSAGSLEANAGIRDSWVTAEWRRNVVADGAFDLSGDAWVLGVVLDR